MIVSITGWQYSRLLDIAVKRKSADGIHTQGSVMLVGPDGCRNPLMKVCVILLNTFKPKTKFHAAGSFLNVHMYSPPNKSHAFMLPIGSLPFTQMPTVELYVELGESSPNIHTISSHFF
jgi:hypothetical protein